MRLLHYLEIENFKRFGERQRIELDHPAVLIGPNNCGKTSAIQALALWAQAVQTWYDARQGSTASSRQLALQSPGHRLLCLGSYLGAQRFQHRAQHSLGLARQGRSGAQVAVEPVQQQRGGGSVAGDPGQLPQQG